MHQGYPEPFLDSHVWWMQGALQANDNEQNEINLGKMKRKEQRYNYLNDVTTKINPQTWEQMGIENAHEQLPKARDFQDMAVQIVMRVGDDLNDFNDNLTKEQGQKLKNHYLNNDNIRNLFGNVASRITFKNEDGKVKQYYYQNEDDNWKVDHSLQALKIVGEITYEELPFTPQETYKYITGNNMYGGWTDKYAQNFDQIMKSLREYWKTVKW